MGYMLRVRLSSFFAGAASASGLGFHLLHKDCVIAQEAISEQVKNVHDSLDARLTALENLKRLDTTADLEVSE